MNTNFFNQIAQLDFTGNLQLTITKGVENNLIVLVYLNNEQCGDNAKNLIPPLTYNGTPQEFDEEFFEKITTPVQKVSGLMVDMENFQMQLDDAKKQSAMEKDKSDKEKKLQDAKDKKYKDAMAKADELEKEGKYRDAWVKVPEPAEYPEKKEEIIKRRSELSAKFAPDLFGTPQEQEKSEPQQEGLYPNYPESEENDVYYEEDEQEY
ncbi:PRTRC system protein E [Flavobacterium dauae]|uniref:PRTRC system protein E n=1 Tax=Flavobacterium dauae TaxID=1563479 RepID=UPI00101B3CFC|nr:PRTRC system protein E [Flavobacterium dauae]WLD24289.1 PRTRC system protein E [Flavobacterium dauae]